jgi:hypothetical protein
MQTGIAGTKIDEEVSMGRNRFFRLMLLLAILIVGMVPSPGLGADAAAGPGGKATTHTLTITKEGNGTVTSVPHGIDCGATCTRSFPERRWVLLNPEPDADSFFTGWTGACSGMKPCIVPMTEDRTVGATFKSGPHIVVHPAKVDFGRVKVNHSKHEHITVLNRGKRDLALGVIFLDGADASEYSLVHNECSGRAVRPHHGCHFTVVFHPTVGGTLNASVEIPSDDPETPQVSVPLSGTVKGGSNPPEELL